ncbi:hypothetical protein MBLNU230_g1847t1 [Neophaeotheca triangularis]
MDKKKNGSLESMYPDDTIVFDVNPQYAAIGRNTQLQLLPLCPEPPKPGTLVTVYNESRRQRVCALSNARPSRLAFAKGSQISITEENQPRVILPGTGRAITSLAWAHSDVDLLASGAIDGSVCFWNIRRPLRPIRLTNGHSPCFFLQFDPARTALLVSCHADGVARIWRTNIWHDPIELDRFVVPGGVCSLAWHPHVPGNLVTASSLGKLQVWRPLQHVPSDYSHRDDISHAQPKLSRALWSLQLSKAARQVMWLGLHGIAVLTGSGEEFAVISTDSDSSSPDVVLSVSLRDSIGQAQRVALLSGDELPTEILALNGNRSCRLTLPQHVTDGVGSCTKGNSREAGDTNEFLNVNEGLQHAPSAVEDVGHADTGITAKTSQPSMTCHGLKKRGSEVHALYMQDALSTSALPGSNFEGSSAETSLEVPQVEATKSLEPFKTREDNSSMPFLSPGVPARSAADDLPAIDDTLTLTEPLPKLDVSEPSSGQDHDSDSDDGTFGDELHGSGTLLPGGINVPLPKACGALFAPNGQLLTFFPTKPLPHSVPEEPDRFGPTLKTSEARVGAKVFPSFGDVRSTLRFEAATSDDSIAGSSDEAIENDASHEQLDVKDRNIWTKKVALLGREPEKTADQRRIRVTVYPTDQSSPGERVLTEEYRFQSEKGEQVASVCRYNALVARSSKLSAISNVWDLLALLMGGTMPIESFGHERAGIDVSQYFQHAMVQDEEKARLPSTYPNLGWDHHPLGSGWLILQVFEWAEKLADIRLLACMSALLAEHERTDTKLVKDRQPDVTTPSHIPVLRARISSQAGLRESPMKNGTDSRPTSRQVSQPGTPLLLDPTINTPPLGFPSLHPQNSRLPASGSISPEQSRNSFGAAAKSYAQSITDRFAQYGTSPPTKKLSSSPGNELSNSLPTASSSWSKSVSFVTPSTYTAAASQGSRNTGHQNTDYDSDRTVEDDTPPQTPKGSGSPVAVSLKNQDEFPGDHLGTNRKSLLPRQLLAKSRIWQRFHAEQLRMKELWQEAAEMESLSGSLGDGAPKEGPGKDDTASMFASVSCSICACLIDRLAHICPVCSSVAHVQCLQDQAKFEDEETVLCSGCAVNIG